MLGTKLGSATRTVCPHAESFLQPINYVFREIILCMLVCLCAHVTASHVKVRGLLLRTHLSFLHIMGPGDEIHVIVPSGKHLYPSFVSCLLSYMKGVF